MFNLFCFLRAREVESYRFGARYYCSLSTPYRPLAFHPAKLPLIPRVSLPKIPFSPRTIPRCDPKGSVVEAPRIGFRRAPRMSSSTTANPATPPTNAQQKVLTVPRFERIPKSHVLSQSGYVEVRRTTEGVMRENPGRNLRPSCEISVCRVSLECGCRENVLIDNAVNPLGFRPSPQQYSIPRSSPFYHPTD